MTARRRQRVRQLLLAAVLVVVASMLPACDKKHESTQQPSTSTTPDATAASRDVLTTYDNWLTAYNKIAARGYVAATDDAVLKQYIVEPNLTKTTDGLKKLVELNVVRRGAPTWTDRVTALNLDANPATAALEVCYDQTHYESVDKTTGENLTAPNQLLRYKLAVSAKRVNGRWYISEETAQRNTAC